MTGIDMVHVPYRGVVLAHTDLIAGRIQVMFDSVPSSIGYIRAGQTRALAVTTATRLDVLPELPTIAEFVPGFEVTGWFGVCAPKDTPPEIVALVNREINAAIADPTLRHSSSISASRRCPARRPNLESSSSAKLRNGRMWLNSRASRWRESGAAKIHRTWFACAAAPA